MKNDTLQSPHSFYSWMWKIMKNKYENMRRKADFDLSAIDLDSVTDIVADVGDSPDDKAVKDEQVDKLRIYAERIALQAVIKQ